MKSFIAALAFAALVASASARCTSGYCNFNFQDDLGADLIEGRYYIHALAPGTSNSRNVAASCWTLDLKQDTNAAGVDEPGTTQVHLCAGDNCNVGSGQFIQNPSTGVLAYLPTGAPEPYDAFIVYADGRKMLGYICDERSNTTTHWVFSKTQFPTPDELDQYFTIFRVVGLPQITQATSEIISHSATCPYTDPLE